MLFLWGGLVASPFLCFCLLRFVFVGGVVSLSRGAAFFGRVVFFRFVALAFSLGGLLVMAVVGFSGSRSLAPAFAPLVGRVVSACAGRSVVVGCAAGLDEMVRAACPHAVVFAVGSGRWGAGRGAFAARSIALVRHVAAASAGRFVCFPASPCPHGLRPSPSASVCFGGLGSGSWASAAFAVGLGLPLALFPCGFDSLPTWGDWQPLHGEWHGGFKLISPASQLNLF